MERLRSVLAVTMLLCVAGLGTWARYEASAQAGVDGTAATGPTVPGSTRAQSYQAPTLSFGAIHAGGRQPTTLQITESTLRGALARGTLVVAPDSGRRYRVRMVRGQDEPNGAWTAVGRVQTRLGPQSMVVTVHGRDVFGVLPQADGSLLQITTTRGITTIRPAAGMVPPGQSAARPDFLVPPRSAGHTDAQAAASRAYLAEAVAEDVQPARIDVLGLYTDELVALRGSVAAAETEVANNVAVADQAHLDSGTHVRIRLVGMKQVTLDQFAFNDELLDQITRDGLEHLLRQSLSADLVFVLRPYVEDDANCGTGWLIGQFTGPDPIDPEYGYSVANVGPCSPYVLAHELGHNMGSMHDRETATGYSGEVVYGAFPWSFGYRVGGEGGFSTIMAYSADDMPRIGYYSSPLSNACGRPCGVENEADNVRSLDGLAHTIAAFREPDAGIRMGDVAGIESVEGDANLVMVPVFFNGGAGSPEGAILHVEAVGGSAEEGADYSFSDTLDPGPNMDVAYVAVTILGDNDVEGDETAVLRISSPDDLEISDPTATLTIVDDDPRDLLYGHVTFPSGSTPPTTSFPLYFAGAEGGGRRVDVAPPDFEYTVPVIPDSRVKITSAPPIPFIGAPLEVVPREGQRRVDYHVVEGVQVSGRVTKPEDGPSLPWVIIVRITAIDSQGEETASSLNFWDVGDEYSLMVFPGSLVDITTSAAAPPYKDFRFRSRVYDDLVQDIALAYDPSLVLVGKDVIDEAEAPIELGVEFALSSSAMEEGATFEWHTEDGTAVAGSDYVASGGTVVLQPGDTAAHATITILGGSDHEPTETFRIVIGDAEHLVPTSPVQQITIRDDDDAEEGGGGGVRTGGPAQKLPVP